MLRTDQYVRMRLSFFEFVVVRNLIVHGSKKVLDRNFLLFFGGEEGASGWVINVFCIAPWLDHTRPD